MHCFFHWLNLRHDLILFVWTYNFYYMATSLISCGIVHQLTVGWSNHFTYMFYYNMTNSIFSCGIVYQLAVGWSNHFMIPISFCNSVDNVSHFKINSSCNTVTFHFSSLTYDWTHFTKLLLIKVTMSGLCYHKIMFVYSTNFIVIYLLFKYILMNHNF